MELKDKTTLSREEAAARLHAIADELASGNDVVIERETMRFVAHVPDQVNLKVEFEIEDDGPDHRPKCTDPRVNCLGSPWSCP